jgi:hypothetical protein
VSRLPQPTTTLHPSGLSGKPGAGARGVLEDGLAGFGICMVCRRMVLLGSAEGELGQLEFQAYEVCGRTYGLDRYGASMALKRMILSDLVQVRHTERWFCQT